MRPRRAGVPLLAGAILLGGCATSVSFGTSEVVACRAGDDAQPADGVVLMAQAVPSAEWVPCLSGMPLGWHLDDLEAEPGSARFWLNSDRHGTRALQVRLTPECDTGGATEVPSEREGMRRFELVHEVTPRYQGIRFYAFDGGCISVLFTLTGADSAEPLAVASQGLDVLPRADLRAHVREKTGGRLDLDPPGHEDGGP